jgi:hypothetical protein
MLPKRTKLSHSCLTYDDEQYRVAVIGIPATDPEAPKASGLGFRLFFSNS